MTIRKWIALVAIVAPLSCQRDQPTQSSQSAADVRLRFGQTPFALTMGAWMRLSVTLVDGQGDSTAAPASISIVSRNPAVIRVDSGTKLQSTGQGSAWIVASLSTPVKTLTDSIKVDVVCTAELVVQFTPASRTLAVGESFTPSLTLYGCGGYLTFTDTFRWSANDSTIIHVDSLTGTTTGLRPGVTFLHANGVRFGQFNGLAVTVTAP